MKAVTPIRKQILTALLLLFVITEAVLYVLIQTVPQRNFATPAYLSVILVFLFSFACYLSPRDRYSYLVNLALVFTLGADFCLVMTTPAEELFGVVVFIGAQLSYFLYILIRERGRLFWAHIAVRASVTAFAALLPHLLLGSSADVLSVVSVIYYSELILNVIFSLFHRELRLFSAGLILFSLCDLSIGLENLSDYFSVGGVISAIKNADVNIAWLFYLPSQVLISASLIRWRKAFLKSSE